MQLFTKQVLMSAKITFVLLLAASLQITARGLAQKVTLEMDHAPLKTVMDSISGQTGYLFFYQLDQLKQSQPVTIHVRDGDMKEILTRIFAHQPFTYSIANQTIVLTTKAATGSVNPIPPVLQQDVHGRVTNEKGESIAGASILIKGTNTGTITDENGNFILENADPNSVLRVTAIGYAPKEIALHGNTTLQIILMASVSKLDEMQVIAYGQVSKRLQTGNVTTIEAADIEKQPVQNPLLALQGRVPGLVVEQATGLPGTGVTVRIQGQNSLSMGNDPLIVIDGVPYPSQMLPSLAGILGSSGSSHQTITGNPLSFINPGDIESISVLKDADATSIYGSRAAAGAILITTKKAKSGPTSVKASFQSGFGKVSNELNLLNTKQYLEIRHEAFANDGVTPSATQYDINGTWDTTRYTDWQKELIGNTAKYTDAQLTLSGGTANTSFLLNGNYHRETTVFPGDLSDQKGTVYFNFNNASINNKLQTQFSGSYTSDRNKIIGVDLTNAAIHLAPNAPALYNADGTLNWAPLPNGNSTWNNPLNYLERLYRINTSNLVGNLLLSYQIAKGLHVKTTFGYTDLHAQEILTLPTTAARPEIRSLITGSSSFGNGEIRTWQVEPQLTYSKNIGKGTLSALAGTTILTTVNQRQAFNASGFTSDAVLEDIKSASTVTVSSTTSSIYRYNALFGRINYNLENKYILNLSGRRDGSSRFGSKNQFHNFGSVGAAWIFSDELFIQRILPRLSFGKFRFSYGTTGNDQIGDYTFMDLYESRPQSNNYQGIVGINPIGLSNPYLQWESTRKLEVGLDIGVFQDRILFTASYYDNRSSNQLQLYALPIQTGFGGITENFPATIKNFGWEFKINSTNIHSDHFSWATTFNLTIPKNTLLKYPNLESSSNKDFLIVGKPITITKLNQFAGVDAETGLYQFIDKNGTLNSDVGYGSENKIAIINRVPKFYGGIQNIISYNGIELTFLIQFFKQVGPNYLLGYNAGVFSGTSNFGNQPVSILNRWQKPGDNSTIQKVTSYFYNYPTSDYADASTAAWSDASYVRLKNLSLSWELPAKWRNKLDLKQTKIYLLGQNLITITNYKGLDPETKSSTTLPPLRVLTFGIQLSL